MMPTELDGTPARVVLEEGNISMNSASDKWIIRHHGTPFLLELVFYLEVEPEVFYLTSCCHARSQRAGDNRGQCSSCKEPIANSHMIADGCYLNESSEIIESWLSPHFGPLEEVMEASLLEDFIKSFVATHGRPLDVYLTKIENDANAIADPDFMGEVKLALKNSIPELRELRVPLGESFGHDLLGISSTYGYRLLPRGEEIIEIADPETAGYRL